MATTTPSRGRRAWPIVLLVALLLLVWLAVWQRGRIVSWFEGAPGADATGVEGEPEGAPSVPLDAPEEADVAPGPAEQRWLEVTGTLPEWPLGERAPDCAAVEAARAALCERLDARAEAEGLSVAPGACARIDAAYDALVATRPVLAGEARSPSLLAANATHLFRTLGRRDVRFAASLLRLEADAVEPIAATLFAWVECRPDGEALSYDYAAFGFSTLGGQAYLRRRSPRVEALAAFYGVVVIDRAEREGRNASGLDPRRELGRVRELIAGQPLHFRDRYLDELDGIADRWSSR